MFACSRRFGSGGLARSAISIRSIGEFEGGFTISVCRACQNPPCIKVCPTDALRIRKGGGVIQNFSKCIGCGLCVDNCPNKAIFWNYESKKPIICTHCGYCAVYCPHDLLTLKEATPK
jgi:Fe-S-cluster-containing dehydrogenase component